MNDRLQIDLFGSFQVMVNGVSAEFRTDALRVLLTYLALHRGTPQRRDTLAGLLSPDRPNTEALTYLRNRLTRLRQAVDDAAATPPWFEVDRKQIGLRAGDDIVVDVLRFDGLLDAVDAHDHWTLSGCPTCMQRLQQAVVLLRGELLAGVNFASDTWDAWLLAQREHYQQRASKATTLLRDALLARGDWHAAIAVAQQQLSAESWDESAHRAIMQAQHQLGNRSQALAQYDRCQQLLWEELGVEPEAATSDLAAAIRTATETNAEPSASNVPNNLPQSIGPFFGRNEELSKLLDRLVEPNQRLITLVGPGGIGKTRLAIEAGRQAAASFPDGTWFIALDQIQGGADQIQIAVGEAAGLGQPQQPLTADQVLVLLRDKQPLLLFDNCESALDQLDFLGTWLRRAPSIACLATSREPLNFQAEATVAIDGLPLGNGKPNAAESLFIDRARMARADFAISAESLKQIQQICTLVDGSPLGISLAAAWVRRRTLPQIIDSIGQSLDFLSSRLRDIDPRHRSMRAVLQASWELLTPGDQSVLAALAVFPGSFSAEAAAQIADASLFDLDTLCEKSLLQQQLEEGRYTMHSLVRQFAAPKLGDQAATIDAKFAEYYCQFAEQHHLAIDLLQPEWTNLATGITKAHAAKAWTRVLDFVASLDNPWFRQIRFADMQQALPLAIDAATALDEQPALAYMHLRLAEVAVEQNRYDSAETQLDQALQCYFQLEESLGVARVKHLQGRIQLEQSAFESAEKLFVESQHIYADEDALEGVATNLNHVALCHLNYHKDDEAAYEYLEQAVALLDAAPPSTVQVESLRHIARIKVRFGEYDSAESDLAKAADICLTLNDIGEHAAVLYEQLILHKRREQYAKAIELGQQCLQQFKAIGSLRWEGLVQTQLGVIYQAVDQLDEAHTRFESGLTIFEELDDHYEQAYSHYYLFNLFEQMGNIIASVAAKEQAMLLARQLKLHRLYDHLAEANG